MGGCMSSESSFSIRSNSSSSFSAYVISPKGELRPYSTPAIVSDVLSTEAKDFSASLDSFFLCNSDNMSYDQTLIALDAQAELDAGQVYFVLPISKLRGRLSASEMAALAVKASVALNSKSATSSSSRSSKVKLASGQKRKNNKSKISPFVVMETSKINVIVDEEAQNKRLFQNTSSYKPQASSSSSSSSLGVSRSGSIRKIQRYSSRKARLAVRSFKLRLSTIYESESSHDQSHKYY